MSETSTFRTVDRLQRVGGPWGLAAVVANGLSILFWMILAFTDNSPGSAAIASALIIGIYAFNIMFLFSRSNRYMPLIVAMIAFLHVIVGFGLLIVLLSGGGDMLSDAEWFGLSIWFLSLGITTMIATWKKN